MACTTLVLGGARSGKTRRALTLAAGYGRRVMIATAEARDAEMADRIAKHQAERGPSWTTLEAPKLIAPAIVSLNAETRPQATGPTVAVVDCLTLWLTNLMLAEDDVEQATRSLIEAVSNSSVDIVLISNEVGFGLVPDTPLGRAFRDAQGSLNQRIAEIADVVEFVAAGLPLRLKP